MKELNLLENLRLHVTLVSVGLVYLAVTCKYASCLDEDESNPLLTLPKPAELRFDKFVVQWLEKWATQDEKNRGLIRRMLLDKASDFSLRATTEELVERNGFRFESHRIGSADHYETKMIRVVNPKINTGSLRPPVVLYGGESVSPGLFVSVGVGQNHPEVWPRLLVGSNSSEIEIIYRPPFANRSLAFALANEGHDVWLVPARGVDEANRKRTTNHDNLRYPADHDRFMEFLQVFNIGDRRKSYWSFGPDEIIKHELGNQLEHILGASRSQKLSLVTFADGAALALGFLSHRPNFARDHLNTLVALGPLVFGNPHNLILKTTAFFAKLQSLASLNGFLANNDPLMMTQIDELIRDKFVALCQPRLVRYAICKPLLDLFYGKSEGFRTYLDLNLLRHIARPQSVRSVLQQTQNSVEQKLRAADYGPLINPIVYLSLSPPDFRLNETLTPRLLLISGSQDAIATPWAVRKLEMALCGEKRRENCRSIRVHGYNHLDLIAGHDVDMKVNREVLQELEVALGGTEKIIEEVSVEAEEKQIDVRSFQSTTTIYPPHNDKDDQ